MKKMFLASSISYVVSDIARQIVAKNKNLVFIDTASEVEEGNKPWLEKDKKSLIDSGFEVLEYTITGKTKKDIESDLESFGIIFFSGGNTMYLLQELQKSSSLDLFRKWVESGDKIYIGSSAGSIVAGPEISYISGVDSVEKAPELKGYKGLNLVNFGIFPHWGNPFFKDLYLNRRLENSYDEPENPIVILRDNQYAKVVDDKFEIISV